MPNKYLFLFLSLERYIPGHDHIAHREGGSHVSQIMFFCGHKTHCCVVNSERAFRDAVDNVERHFAVVGVLEEMDKSLAVLERYLPRFFDGVTQVSCWVHVFHDCNLNTDKWITSGPVRSIHSSR